MDPLPARGGMHRKLVTISLLAVISAGALAFGRAVARGAETPASGPATPTARTNKMTALFDHRSCSEDDFRRQLEDNAAAKAFKALLPVSLQMTELNGNEKYFRLSADLPTNASNPGTVQTGDLMIYGGKTLVLFYETFPTSYSYTRLGRINDPTGLAAALGAGDADSFLRNSRSRKLISQTTLAHHSSSLFCQREPTPEHAANRPSAPPTDLQTLTQTL